MNDWPHSKPINDGMIEPSLTEEPDTLNMSSGLSAKVVLTDQGHTLDVLMLLVNFLNNYGVGAHNFDK